MKNTQDISLHHQNKNALFCVNKQKFRYAFSWSQKNLLDFLQGCMIVF